MAIIGAQPQLAQNVIIRGREDVLGVLFSITIAIAAVLPRHEMHERDTVFTIIAVTTLSTVAMVLYPLVGHLFHFTQAQTGVFLGGTIHDVAQVVGAGYSVSPETGDVATIIKLLRVALLVRAVLSISILARQVEPEAGPAGERQSLVPGFLVVFIVHVVISCF